MASYLPVAVATLVRAAATDQPVRITFRGATVTALVSLVTDDRDVAVVRPVTGGSATALLMTEVRHVRIAWRAKGVA